MIIYLVLHADVAKLADALDLGSSGRPWGFESLHPHHNPNGLTVILFHLNDINWDVLMFTSLGCT